MKIENDVIASGIIGVALGVLFTWLIMSRKNITHFEYDPNTGKMVDIVELH